MMKKTKKNKIQVQVVPGAPQFDVSDFPKGVERSNGNGAVYFRQNTVLSLTPGEVKHVKEKRPDMMKFLVINEIKKPTEEQLKKRMAAKAALANAGKVEELAKEEVEGKAITAKSPQPATPQNEPATRNTKDAPTKKQKR